jgi:hypothetical protein
MHQAQASIAIDTAENLLQNYKANAATGQKNETLAMESKTFNDSAKI